MVQAPGWLVFINDVWSLAADLFDYIDLEQDFAQNQSFSQSIKQGLDRMFTITKCTISANNSIHLIIMSCTLNLDLLFITIDLSGLYLCLKGEIWTGNQTAETEIWSTNQCPVWPFVSIAFQNKIKVHPTALCCLLRQVLLCWVPI